MSYVWHEIHRTSTQLGKIYPTPKTNPGYVPDSFSCVACFWCEGVETDWAIATECVCCGSEEIGDPGKKTSEETANLKLPDYEVKEMSEGSWFVMFIISVLLVNKSEIIWIVVIWR